MPPQSRANQLDLLEQNLAHLGRIGQVCSERLLVADALGFAIGNDRAIVDAVCQAEITLCFRSEHLLEPFARSNAKVADGADAVVLQPRGSRLADSPKLAHRK